MFARNRICTMSVQMTEPTLQYNDIDGDHVFEIHGECVTIGRASDQDVVLKESFASRRHATINRQGDGFEVVDQNSSHGTFLNGKRIDRARLRSGDKIQFGLADASSFCFVLPDSGSLSGIRANELLSALSGFDPATTGDVPRPAREIGKLSFFLTRRDSLTRAERSRTSSMRY